MIVSVINWQPPSTTDFVSVHYYIYIYHKYLCIVIYEALRFDVAQGRMNGAPNEDSNSLV